MKGIAVISGKGGTGKTSLAASFVALAASDGVVVTADCDVDAPNLHLLLHAQVRQAHEFRGSYKAVVDPPSCVRCGLCESYCRYDAIHDGVVDPLSCEGCGVCARVCPQQAITMRQELSGRWFVSQGPYGPMVHARMEPGEEGSGRLVAVLREQAARLARAHGAALLVSDGPPGIGCPVISTLTGADLAVVVTEPTVSGLHDLERVLATCRHFGIPALICVNRYDLYEPGTRAILEACRRLEVPVAGCVPYDRTVTDAIVHGMPVVEYTPQGAASQAIRRVWSSVSAHLGR